MNTFVYTFATMAGILGQFDPAPAYNGQNCRHDHTATSGNSLPQYGRSFPGRRYLPSDRDRDAAGCGCATCDSSSPCSIDNCKRQRCANCDHSLLPGQSNVSTGFGPGRGQSFLNELPARRLPRHQDRIQLLCPVTGEKLGSMGSPIAVHVMGRTLQVCCNSCVSAIRRNPEMYLRQFDADLVSGNQVRPQSDDLHRFPAQETHQPTRRSQQKLCPVTGEELGSMGPPVAVNVGGRMIDVCCQACVGAVRRNPTKYLQLDAEEPNTLPMADPRSSVKPRALF